MSFAKDGYTPGEMVQMIIELDNTNCTANINTISITVTNQVTLRSGTGAATSDSRTFMNKTVNGVPAGVAYVVHLFLDREIKLLKNNSKCQTIHKLSLLVQEHYSLHNILWESK